MGTKRRLWDELAAGWFDEELYAGIIEAHLRGAPRSERRRVLRETVDGLASPAPPRDLPDVAGTVPPPSTAVLDDVLDLSWLASPLSVVRRCFALDSDDDATRFLQDLARPPG